MSLTLLNVKNKPVIYLLIALLLLPIPFIMHRQKSSHPQPLTELIRNHSITYNKPAPGFFEGALLGNGGMGVVVTTRPDAIVFYFGHNNVWDIRIAEDNSGIQDFNYVFNRVKNIPVKHSKLIRDKWYMAYTKKAIENYSKPYPRPFPCGSVVLGFDRRKVQLLGHMLDISNGVCTVKLLTADKKKLFLKVMTDMSEDRLLMQLVDAAGQPYENVFNRMRILADPSTPKEFPAFKAVESLKDGTFFLRQTLPSQIQEKYIANPKDKAFSLTVKTDNPLKKTKHVNWDGHLEKMPELEGSLSDEAGFSAVVSLQQGLNTEVDQDLPDVETPSYNGFTTTLAKNNIAWHRYWSKSSIELSDNLLEEIWYRNLYFLNCAAKDGVACPGLFANWSYNNIGTEWHGDYHMNYNLEQSFWATFSSNHLEKNLPYVNLIESLMPLSKKWAKDYYHLPGAFIPHAAFPVEMTTNPFPLPDWGWQVSETPWAVQGLWWHYLYSSDTAFLRARAYEPIKAAVQFLTHYIKRKDVYETDRWNDERYHIFPTVVPELYGLTPGLKYNYDCSLDLTLTKFIFKAFQRATTVLNTTTTEKELLTDIDKILKNYPDYPTATSNTNGEVYVSVPGEDPGIVYNVPVPLSPVFPGEEYGLHSSKSILNKAINTYRNQQNEGGNDLVFLNLQAARLGTLDLEQFKRQVTYCLMPNGTAANFVMQTGGRYWDLTNYTFMANSGIWFENFALPAVINECLMQSYNEVIRLFPNWPKAKDASFSNLRAAGAFLVSARQVDGEVEEVKIISEKGTKLQILIPWGKSGHIITANKKIKIDKELLILDTHPGEVIIFRP